MPRCPPRGGIIDQRFHGLTHVCGGRMRACVKRRILVIDDACGDAARESVRRGRKRIPEVVAADLFFDAANPKAAERRSVQDFLRAIGGGRDSRYPRDRSLYQVMRVETHVRGIPRPLGRPEAFSLMEVVDPL